MSNLSQQFDGDALQRARYIRNNQVKLTRVLKPKLLGPRRKISGRGPSRLSSGVVYTPVDENTTIVHWQGESLTKPSDEYLKGQNQRVYDALKESGFNVTMKNGKIHVQH